MILFLRRSGLLLGHLEVNRLPFGAVRVGWPVRDRLYIHLTSLGDDDGDLSSASSGGGCRVGAWNCDGTAMEGESD